MAINVKPIEKLKFRSPARRRRRAPATPDRTPTPLGRAVASAADPTPLTIGRDPIPTATGIAQRLGWLEREAALDQTPLTVHGDPLAAPLHDPLLRAAAPSSLLHEGESAGALWERSRGAETRVIGLTWVDSFQGVIALPARGISEPGHLAGRRLGLPRDDSAPFDARRAAARRGLHGALALAGSFPDEATEFDIPVAADAEPYAAELAALQRREVDAIFLSGAAGLAAAARIGALTVVDLGAHLDPMVRAGATTPAVLTVDAELLARQPNVVVRMLAVLMRTGAWAQAHPAEATDHVARETLTTPADVLAAHGEGWHERLHLDLSHHKLDALRAQHDFLRTHGFLEADVDIDAWVDPRPLGMARELLAAERTAWV
jgi:ABC-type nitrate/sulfonate/bicarbonate transport system substrate-binding protein